MAFLTFHEPLVKRQSIDSSQASNTATEAEAAEAAVASATPPPVDTSASENTGYDARTEGGGRDGGVNRDNGQGRTSTGAQGIRSEAETDKRNGRSAAGTTPLKNDSATRVNGLEKTVAAVTPQRDQRTEEGQQGRHHQRTNDARRRNHNNGDGDRARKKASGADEASADIMPSRQLAVTAALTPESVVPVPFSPASAGAGSTASSGVSPRACSPAVSRGVGNGKVSSVAELLQHQAGDAVEALRLESLELFSDEDEA